MEKDNFLEKLQKLVELAKSKHQEIDVTEVNNFFVGDNLSPEQMEQIYSYLEAERIAVIPVIDESILAEEPLLLDDVDDDSFMKDVEEEDIDLDAIDLLEGIGTEDPVRMYLKEI
ncbi:MAG: RNA polymerase sigma factor region1.1 domain-containing protein, partial [Hungatella sp.]